MRHVPLSRMDAPEVKPGRLPPLLWQPCGVVEVPRVAPGTGPHVAKALCTGCGGLLKWLPRVFLEPASTIHQQKGRAPMLNICALVGMFEREPHVRSHPETGTPVVALTVRVEEVGKDGRAFLTYIPVECYGRCAAHAETLSKETCVAVEGKIGWKSYDKNGEKRSTLMGVARQISVLTLTAAEAFT